MVASNRATKVCPPIPESCNRFNTNGHGKGNGFGHAGGRGRGYGKGGGYGHGKGDSISGIEEYYIL